MRKKAEFPFGTQPFASLAEHQFHPHSMFRRSFTPLYGSILHRSKQALRVFTSDDGGQPHVRDQDELIRSTVEIRA